MKHPRTSGLVAIVSGITAATLSLGMPAHAAGPFNGSPVTIGGYTWTVQDVPFAVAEAGYTAGMTTFSDAFAYGEVLIGDGVSTASVDCIDGGVSDPDSNGDIVISCAPTQVLSFDVITEIRLFGEGDLARQLVVVRNGGTEPMNLRWEYFVAMGSTQFRATTSAPALGVPSLTASDNWQYNDSATSGGFNAAVAWGLTGAPRVHTDAVTVQSNAFSIRSRPLAPDANILAPGESVALAFFSKVDVIGSGAPDGDAAVAAVTSEFDSFSGRLVRGLPSNAVVQNWGTAPAAESPTTPITPPAPELAETGSPGAALLVAALAAGALLTGGAMVVTRRRRAEAIAAV